MWTVLEHRRVEKQIESIPREILKRYETWKDIVAISGPDGLRLIEGFHDETRRGKKKVRRSSRLGQCWRVMYRTKARHVLVRAIRGK